VLKEVYYDNSTTVLSTLDCKILFSNLDEVIALSRKIIDDLHQISVGEVFLKNEKELQDVYCEYCKSNEQAMNKVAEFNSPDCPAHIAEYFKICQAQLAGRTAAWDFSSLIIKPVQRVLKYPLLLRQLVKETPQDDLDYNNLKNAVLCLDSVANTINTVKKRQDIVEKAASKNSSNVIHGLNKKIYRGAQQIKNAALGDESTDFTYDLLRLRFETQQKQIPILIGNIQNWQSMFKGTILAQDDLVVLFSEVYDDHRKDIITEYKIGIGTLKEYIPTITNETQKIIVMLESLEKIFKNPAKLMRKRDAKMLDFTRAKDMEDRGEVVDKVLKMSCEEYDALNSQLVEELPKFLELVCEYVEHALVAFSRSQAVAVEVIVEMLVRMEGFVDVEGVQDGLFDLVLLKKWRIANGGLIFVNQLTFSPSCARFRL